MFPKKWKRELRIHINCLFVFQGLFYGRAGEILTMRLRHLAFKAMLYQVSIWFVLFILFKMCF